MKKFLFFKITVFLTFIGFETKSQHVPTANWCISFDNPKRNLTLDNVSNLARQRTAMGQWNKIPNTDISYCSNLSSMDMWVDTICSIVNRKCNKDPSFTVNPLNLPRYIKYDCEIVDMSTTGMSYRNYNAQFKTGEFGWDNNYYPPPGTKGIADKRTHIVFMKISNNACCNPDDPNIVVTTPPPSPKKEEPIARKDSIIYYPVPEPYAVHDTVRIRDTVRLYREQAMNQACGCTINNYYYYGNDGNKNYVYREDWRMQERGRTNYAFHDDYYENYGGYDNYGYGHYEPPRWQFYGGLVLNWQKDNPGTTTVTPGGPAPVNWNPDLGQGPNTSPFVPFPGGPAPVPFIRFR
jgi:hypothetical protein